MGGAILAGVSFRVVAIVLLVSAAARTVLRHAPPPLLATSTAARSPVHHFRGPLAICQSAMRSATTKVPAHDRSGICLAARSHHQLVDADMRWLLDGEDDRARDVDRHERLGALEHVLDDLRRVHGDGLKL